MVKSRIKTSSEVFRQIASSLRVAAIRPSVYGYEPHPKQRDFHSSTARKKLFIGGNRSGKTVGGAVEMVDALLGRDPFKPVKHPPPIQARAVGVDFDHGIEKIVKPEIARWLPPSALQNGSWEDSYSKELRTLTLENGSTLEFMSYDQALNKFAGTSRHKIWFDEEPPQEIYQECLMRLIDVAGDFWITMTPVEGMTWVYDQLYMARMTDPDIHVTEVDIEENPHINPGEIDIVMAGLSSDDVQARRHGKFVQIGGLIYKMFNESHLIEGDFVPPRDFLHLRGMDHGFTNPTCWLWAAVDKDSRIFIYDEHYRAGEIVSWHAAKVHEISKHYVSEFGIVPSYSVGDPSIQNTDPITGTSVLLEYMEHGLAILLGNNDQRAGILRVAQKFVGREGRPELYIVKDRCPMLVWELQRLRWATWANRKMDAQKNRKEEQHKKNDHACDTLRYIVASRPALDVGTYVPEMIGPAGYPEAQDPYSDPVVEIDRSDEFVDSVLGSEY
jgi:phage terminase large subunit-like protein